MSTIIYHNPRCSKSRQTLSLLRDNGIEPEIIEYVDYPPDAATLAKIVQLLGISARELIRTGEGDYKINKAKLENMPDGQVVDWLVANPRVIQRPIVVTEQGARIGRPPESVLEIITQG
jgi:arsenate reductase